MRNYFSIVVIMLSFLQVNKSLQDRLRRERISKSVETLRELLLGPSIEHVSLSTNAINILQGYISFEFSIVKNLLDLLHGKQVAPQKGALVRYTGDTRGPGKTGCKSVFNAFS